MDSKIINKPIILDNCVDGDETRFDNLVGKDYKEFNIIYDVIKRNKEVLSENIKCSYCEHTDGQDIILVQIPTKENDINKLSLPTDGSIFNANIARGILTINITVKKEW